MIWNHFLLAAGISTSTWLLAAFIPKRALIRNILVLAGIAGIAIFIGFLWINLERPPLRTLGETRLWYAFFLPIIGFLTYWRWRYNWMLHYSLALSILFLFINYLHPENFSKTLMPSAVIPPGVAMRVMMSFVCCPVSKSFADARKELVANCLAFDFERPCFAA